MKSVTIPSKAARPTVFVSSTIKDFRDLRAALKYWLEEVGFMVRMSEFNDFDHPPDAKTFEACFDLVRRSDYFILLVGDRRGSWYDEAHAVSVTQQEYRTACDAFQGDGSPRILRFVRREVEVALKEREVGSAPDSAPSTVTDPDFVAAFLSEVKGPQGTAGQHWVAPFSTFRELVSELETALNVPHPLAVEVIHESLRHELGEWLASMMTVYEGVPLYKFQALRELRDKLALTPEAIGRFKTISLTNDDMLDVVMYVIFDRPDPIEMPMRAISHAITSGSLLTWDRTAGRYMSTPLLEQLTALDRQLATYRFRKKYIDDNEIVTWNELWNQTNPSGVPVDAPSMSVYTLFAFNDVHCNVTRLLYAILRFLYRHTDSLEPMLRGYTPIPEFTERFHKDNPTAQDVENWLLKDDPMLASGMQDLSLDSAKALQSLRAILGAEGTHDLLQSLLKTMSPE